MVFTIILLANAYFITIVAYFSQKRNLRYENGYVLATTMSYAQFQSDEVQEILNHEKEMRKKICIVSLFFPLLMFVTKSEAFIMYIFIVSVLGVSMGMGYSTYLSMRKLRALKKSWNVDDAKVLFVDVVANMEIEKAKISKYFYVLPIILLLPSLLKFKINTLAFTIIITGLINVVLFLFFGFILRRRGNTVYTSNRDENIRRNLRAKVYPERVAIILATIFAGITSVLVLALDDFIEGKFILWYLVAEMAVVLSYTIYLVKSEQKIDEEFISSEDDFYDLFGYNNPNDPRILVPSKLNIGNMEINRGNKTGKAIYLISTILIIALVGSVGYFLSPAKYSYEFTGDRMEISAKIYSDKIDLSDVENLELLDEFPKVEMIRTNGAAIESQGYGDFEMKGIGPVRLYIYRNVDKVIHMKTKNKNFYLNMEDDEKTIELYNKIKTNLGE
ncbi:MAG: PH domain-containing protein [Peptoniphilus duerdenii]|uniref:PH domain-containing protein n=1 Tax=Peptoniphilus duerdenii TaxID=507750 RepID=UPI00254DEB11|nr:PH domain-containing protein [Peptoniphilus duerdenii]MDK8276983.1 PH domain-containing protein [Peptoniphilus duerdenii]